MPNSLGVRKKWDVPTKWDVWDAKGEEKGRGREGMGTSYEACGLLIGYTGDLRRGLFK